MLVTLINPPVLIRSDNAATVAPSLPLGLAYIGGYLKNHFEVKAVDSIGENSTQLNKIKNSGYQFYGLSIDDIISRINPSSKVIGLSCMFTSSWKLHKILISKIINMFPESLIVIGGEHATAAHKKILEEFPQDLICVLGEGEETFFEVCKAVEGNLTDSFGKIEGIAYKDSSGKIVSSRRARIKAINNIPWPDWDLFPMENYLNSGLGATVHSKRVIMMYTSRGCPYKCSFCSAPLMWDKYVFHRTPQDLITEIRFYINKYQINHIEFMDLVGLVNKEWTLDFCTKMEAANLGITFTFSPGTRSEILSENILRALKNAGLSRIQYAPDSGSTEEAKVLRKNANLDKMLRSIKWSVELDYTICANILIGFPGQRKRDLFTTFIFCVKLAWVGVHDVLVHNFIPYAGTEFFELLAKDPDYKKFITDDFLITTTAPSLGMVQSYSKHIPNVLLSGMRLITLATCLGVQYLRRPGRIISTIVNLINKTPDTYFENLIYLKLKNKNFNSSQVKEFYMSEFSSISL